MVMSPDPHLNLRADVKATLIALQARIQAGGNWRSCADQARELGHKLDALADMEQPNDRPRHRVVEPPPPPETGAEFMAERLALLREMNRRTRRAQQAVDEHTRRVEVTEVKREPPALGPG